MGFQCLGLGFSNVGKRIEHDFIPCLQTGKLSREGITATANWYGAGDWTEYMLRLAGIPGSCRARICAAEMHSFLAFRCSTDWRSHRTKVAPQVGPYSHCMLLTIVTLAAGLLVASSMLVGIR